MTTQEKLIRNKLSLLESAEYLKNVSEACKVNGVSRQHFYDIKKAYEENGLDGLWEKSRRKPCMKNRVAPEIEDAVVRMACEYPAYGQARAANELKKQGTLVSSGGIRSIRLRHGLEIFAGGANVLFIRCLCQSLYGKNTGYRGGHIERQSTSFCLYCHCNLFFRIISHLLK